MANINLTGFNGIDWNTILTAVMQAESRPLDDLHKQQQAYKDRDSALTSLAGLIGKLQAPIDNLTDSTAFSALAASSSDTSIATASMGSGAAAGQYDLDVAFLAKSQVSSSTNGYTNITDTVADGGALSFTINGSTTQAINVLASTTLGDLRDEINAQNSGVMATIVNDGTNNRLVISSRETGTSSGFTINNSLTNGAGAAVAFAVGQSPTSGNTQDSQNASFTVNGLSIVSQSNTINSAIAGVSVNLLKTGQATVKVSADYSALKEDVRTFVKEYNNLRAFYSRQTKDPLTGKPGPLYGDSVLRQAVSDIKSNLLGANSNGGRYQYLSEIGVELTSTGDLKLDETKFGAAIDSYPGDLAKLFTGASGANGVLSGIKTSLDALDGTAGLIKTVRAGIDTTLKTFLDRIQSQEARLEIRRQELIRIYTAADQAMSALNASTSALQGISSRQV